MIQMPQVAALSQLVKEAPAVGEMMTDGPVLLTAKSQRFGVLVNIEQWNQTARRLAELEMFFEAIEINDRVERGEAETVTFSALVDELGVNPQELARGAEQST